MIACIDPAASLTDTLRRAAVHERPVLLCSFQKESSVILDELLRIAPHARVVTIDTGVLFDETLATWGAFERHYGVRIDVEEAKASAWSGPEHCCGADKVAALERPRAHDAGGSARAARRRRPRRADRALRPRCAAGSAARGRPWPGGPRRRG